MKKSKNQKNSVIRDTLLRIGAINEKNIQLLHSGTRDVITLDVYYDIISNVIFIDNFYVGHHEYISGAYRSSTKYSSNPHEDVVELEDILDTERRIKDYRQFIVGKNICDFGCGLGSFLMQTKPLAYSSCGVELQQNCIDLLNNQGINCFKSINEVPDMLDTVTMFHSLEHLPDPTATLHQLHDKLKISGGCIIIEVPHARDLLIENLHLDSFLEFTLWSQHLILHTRDSLRRLLIDAGFHDIVIQGIQRYSISNHINWILNKTPGGHKSILSVLQTPDLISAYSRALSSIDATDTLVAIASA